MTPGHSTTTWLFGMYVCMQAMQEHVREMESVLAVAVAGRSAAESELAAVQQELALARKLGTAVQQGLATARKLAGFCAWAAMCAWCLPVVGQMRSCGAAEVGSGARAGGVPVPGMQCAPRLPVCVSIERAAEVAVACELVGCWLYTEVSTWQGYGGLCERSVIVARAVLKHFSMPVFCPPAQGILPSLNRAGKGNNNCAVQAYEFLWLHNTCCRLLPT
eukprot:1034474-Pelagomonas_calceolata.AAC.3